MGEWIGGVIDGWLWLNSVQGSTHTAVVNTPDVLR